MHGQVQHYLEFENFLHVGSSWVEHVVGNIVSIRETYNQIYRADRDEEFIRLYYYTG